MKALVLGLAVLIGANVLRCGEQEEEASQGDELSLKEYVAAVKALQENSRRVFDAVGWQGSSPDSTSSDESILVFYRRLFGGTRDSLAGFFDGMRSIHPPSEINEEHQAFIDASQAYQAGLDEFVLKMEQTSALEDLENVAPRNYGAESLVKACSDLQATLGNRGFELDLACEFASSPGGFCFITRAAASGGSFCDAPMVSESDCGWTCYSNTDCETTNGFGVVIPPPPVDSSAVSEPSTGAGCEVSVDFGGVRGRLSPMPPLPPNLVAVSEYLVLEINGDTPAISGFALPLTEETVDPSTIAFYTYDGGEWRRIADVKVVREGRAEGEFSSLPPNLAILKEAR